MKILVIVDVQKEFDDFIQHDLVDGLYSYSEKFEQVYQIWDAHKNVVAPTYKFPNQVDSVQKLFGRKHFSDAVKKYTKEIEKSTDEGTVLKLSNNEGYVVRIDNNHKWFFVNPEITDLISKIKDDEIILVGGADGECLEDIYQAFKTFKLNVNINNKYTFSAQTNNTDSIYEKKILTFNDFRQKNRN